LFRGKATGNDAPNDLDIWHMRTHDAKNPSLETENGLNLQIYGQLGAANLDIANIYV